MLFPSPVSTFFFTAVKKTLSILPGPPQFTSSVHSRAVFKGAWPCTPLCFLQSISQKLTTVSEKEEAKAKLTFTLTKTLHSIFKNSFQMEIPLPFT